MVLGVVYNLTGFQSDLSVASSRGARLAVSEINLDGGVLRRQISLILEDGESRPEILRKKTTTLLRRNPSTTALMGLSDTDMVLAAAPVAAVNGRLFLTSGATSPRLPKEVPRYLFSACFGDNVQAAVAAEWARGTLHAQTGAIVYDAFKSYTRLLQDYFRIRFEELGGRRNVLYHACVSRSGQFRPQGRSIPQGVLAGIPGQRAGCIRRTWLRYRAFALRSHRTFEDCGTACRA